MAQNWAPGERGPKQKQNAGGGRPAGEDIFFFLVKSEPTDTSFSTYSLESKINRSNQRSNHHFLLGKRRWLPFVPDSSRFPLSGTPFSSTLNGPPAESTACYSSTKITRSRMRGGKNEIIPFSKSPKKKGSITPFSDNPTKMGH